ncbi:MAG: hypothetical protein JSV24_11450, partial [Bacteroidales bacterium]
MKTDIRYTISARGKKENYPIEVFLRNNFPLVPFARIDSVFGFVEPSTLYSGRPFLRRQISDEDYIFLRKSNIGLRIPFSNHFVSDEEMERNIPLLEKYHEEGNSLIITNDILAKWIRARFPKYQTEASILKNIETHREIEEALE